MKTLLLASACVLIMPVAAAAQDAAASPTTSNAGATTATPSTPSPATPTRSERAAADLNQGEIIITATRRSQVLSDVPIAVSAVSAEQLRNSGGSDIRQLNQLAPSLLVSSATNESSAVARIRGIGTVGENPGLESSVAVFIDGVYRSRTGVGLTELGEVERIEVLRGPQGTLFGRNASAGLINIITAKPSFDFGGTGEFTYGNYNNYRGQIGLTGPILGDKVAFRIDGVYNKRDGFLPDVISGRDTQNRNRYLIRGQLLIKPTDDLSIRLIGDYSHKNEECCGAAYVAPLQNLTRDASGNVVASPNSILALTRALGGTIAVPGPDDGKYARRIAISPGYGYGQRTRDWGGSGEVNYDFGPASLTSITAYREYKNQSQQDSDFQSLDLLHRTDQNRKFQTFTQELRLQGKLFNDRLDFLVGGYYSHEKLTVDDNIKYGSDFERYYNAQLAALGPNALSTFALAAGYVPEPGTSILNGRGVVRDTFRQTSRNYAFFTHNVLSIVPDKLLLTVGARYTNEKKTLDASFNHNNDLCNALRTGPAFTGPFAGLTPFRPTVTSIACIVNGTSGPGFDPSTDPGATKKEHKFTGTVVLSYKPIDRLLTYASYSRGYKAGGFNLDTSALDALNATLAATRPVNTVGNGRPEAADLRFEPETVDSFEVGAKLDLRQFKLNASLFYEKFNDFQLNTFNGINFEVANIEGCKDDLGGRDRDLIAGNSACTHTKAGVTSKGVELEAYIYPARNLAVTGGVTYADTKYASQLSGLNGVSLAPTLFQLPGRPLSNSSKFVETASIAWTPPLTDTLSALFYVDVRSQSPFDTGSDLDLEKRQEAFTVVNGRIGLYGRDKVWGIEFWGQNLFNVKYQQVAADAPIQGSGTYRQTAQFGTATSQLFITFPAEPRTYGVTVRTRF